MNPELRVTGIVGLYGNGNVMGNIFSDGNVMIESKLLTRWGTQVSHRLA